MEYTSVTSPVWTNAEHTMINCIVDFTADGVGTVPFTADPLDTSNPSSKQIFDECVAGDYGTVAEYVPPPPYVHQFVFQIEITCFNSSQGKSSHLFFC